MKKVLITGGNKGIGLATTKKFLDHKYNVITIARDFSSFKIKSKHLYTIQYDLSNHADIPRLAKQVGTIDILVNNAGIMHALPYDQYPEEKVDELLSVNLKSPIALIRAFSPGMIKKDQGRIVNIASIAGQIGHPDIWYGISKAGVINMTKSFAKLLGDKGIVVNAVAPGPVETDLLKTIPEERKNSIKKTVYSGRFARPEEVADTIFWLATDCPEYINGVCLDINNGAFPR